MKCSSSSFDIGPYIPIFGYPAASEGGVTQLCVYDYEDNGASLIKPKVSETNSNAYTIEGQIPIGDQTALRVPGHMFVENDIVYLQKDGESKKIVIQSVNGDLLNIEKIDEDYNTVSFEDIVEESSDRVVFVGVSAPLKLAQHRLSQGMVVIPALLEGTATILADPSPFRVGDIVCINIETHSDVIDVTFGKEGTPIGVFIMGEDEVEPPTMKICLKHSLIRLL